MDYWRIIYRCAWVLLIIVVPIGIGCMFVPRCSSLRHLHQKRAELAEENSRIEDATRELRARQERFLSDPLFVERVAREAGMVKSNEIVFRISPYDPTQLETITNSMVPVSNAAPRRVTAPPRSPARNASAAQRRRTR
jgi:cell division protein FtsB